jgi:HAE1 family hydrophobic/amphiphilic exporter-1
MEAVKLRLRPIVMTSMAFILGVLPLVFASGASAVARQTIGFTVFGGMLAASSIAIFIVPVLFVIITRFSYGPKKLDELQLQHVELMEKARRIEEANIDPVLEYEIKISRDPNHPDQQ